ncbi:MAG: ATP-binding cassette domain-containing protein, partial [Planctomycetota bacterium]
MTKDADTAVDEPTAAVDLTQATVHFPGGVIGIDIESLTIKSSERIALIGPSGCGKSTLLRVIAGLQTLTSGQLQLDSKHEFDAHSQIAFVFQQAALLPWRTVFENVGLPLLLNPGDLDVPSREQRIADVIDEVQLTHAVNRTPDQLSGGMQMRVSIARALVCRPSLLLLDEPFAALDDVLRNQLGRLVTDMWRQHRFTQVLVTHHIAEAITLSDRICVMSHGRLIQSFQNDLHCDAT